MTSTASRPIIDTDLVLLDVDAGADKQAVIGWLVGRLADAGRTTDPDGLTAAAMAREEQSATGLPGGIAIPHCRSPHVDTASIGFARLQPPVDFGAPDGPADLAFLIAAPEAGGAEHMKLLSSLARALVRKEFVAVVARGVDTRRGSRARRRGAQPGRKAEAGSPGREAGCCEAEDSGRDHRLPDRHRAHVHGRRLAGRRRQRGRAPHCMWRRRVRRAARRWTQSTIAEADAVIFATDVGVKDKQRFAGKPVVASGVKRAINEPDKMIAEALAAATQSERRPCRGFGCRRGRERRARRRCRLGHPYPPDPAHRRELHDPVRRRRRPAHRAWLPVRRLRDREFAGRREAFAALLDSARIGHVIASTNSLTNLPSGGLIQYLGAVLFTLGGLAFIFLVPALAGYISFAIADRPGIAPGFTAGAVAVFVGGGFIGGIVGGLIAGFTALWISRIAAPRWLRGLMPVVIIPLFASLVVGLLMFLLLGRPLAAITSGLTNWLSGMSGSSVIILGVILGLMMCFDLGGPVNKAAYAFATAGLNVADPASLRIMAAVMAAGMVPPLAMALASTIRPGLFTEPERENGRAAWLLGASFISEGAIPFAAADPLRVIPSMMFGGAITGALIMAFDVTLKAPHGGIFVFFAIGNLLWFLIALVVGTVAGALAVIAAKQFAKPTAKLDETPALATA